MKAPVREHVLALLAVAALAVLAYWPLLSQPLLEDDYPNIELARLYGSPSGLSHPIFRFRETFWIMAAAADRLFGCSAPALHSVSIALHIAAAWLVYALGAWRMIGWRVSAIAAGFFAVHEGHQEAVMWYSAASEQLMFVFGLLSLLCWIGFLHAPARRLWYAAALVFFALALASKESAAIFAALLLLPLFGLREARRGFVPWLPFAALGLADVLLIAATRSYSFRFQDGSFSLAAPFWITWPVSFGRLLWFWGVAALAAVYLLRAKKQRRVVLLGAVWIALALAPYSFLTYMHRVPSRQTYLAGAGLAWIVGAAFWAIRGRARRSRSTVLLALAVIVIGSNVGYLWTKKRRQFLERAAPSEALVALAGKVNGPIWVRCYPGPRIVAASAVRLRTGRAPRLIWTAAEASHAAAEFCWK